MKIAEADILAVRGLDDVVLQGGIDWRDTRLDAASVGPAQQLAFDEVLGSVSLTWPLATGGRLGLELQSGYSRLRSDSSATGMSLERWDSRWSTPSVQLSLEQPLLRGFGVNVARADRRRAHIRLDLATAERERVAAALLRDVISGYWELVYSAEDLRIRRASAAAAREQLLMVQANIAVGKQPSSATAEIEVAIALRDDAALTAQRTLIERSSSLAVQCGLPVTEILLGADSLPPVEALSAAAPSLEQVLEAALANNAQLRGVRQQVRASAVEVDVTENGLLPELDVTLAGGRMGNESDPRVPDQLTRNFAGYTLTAGLALEFPIGRHSARGARAAAGERLRKARLDEAAIAAQVRAGVVRGFTQRETARRRAQVLAPSERAASLDLEAERARFEVGRSSNFDVLRRQDQLALVQLLLLRARVDLLGAAAALDSLTGALLRSNGVELRDGER
jgi:outer membrane protein TolC